ncbi:MAG: sensor histidine kinase [Deinococcales bacterium]
MRAVIASSDLAMTLALRAALNGFDVRHIDNADTALLEAHTSNPLVVVVHANLVGTVPASEVAGLLSRRADLRNSWLIAVCPFGQMIQFYEAGLADVEPEPLDLARFKVRLDLGLRAKQAQQSVNLRLEKLEQKLSEVLEEERLRDRLTHMLVHDLKNPISAIIGAVDFVRAEAKNIGQQQIDLLEIAFEESQRLLQLTSNILEVRKIRDGKLRLELAQLGTPDLRRIVKNALMDVGVGVQQRRVRARVPDNLPRFSADEDIVRRILTNLVSNAYKHTLVGGRIVIEARPLENAIEIAVHDDGEGIPSEDIELIFKDFERSRLTGNTRFDTGMGLAFCKLAVEQHGGKIWVQSTRAQGSSFFFTLPQVVAQPDDVEVEVLV